MSADNSDDVQNTEKPEASTAGERRGDATLLIETACFQVNSIPFGPDHEDLCLSPNDILVPTFQLNSLASTSSPLHNVIS